jgi:hypothetical protein
MDDERADQTESVTLLGGPYAGWVVSVERGAREWTLETVAQLATADGLATDGSWEPAELVRLYPERFALRRDRYRRRGSTAVFSYVGREVV